MIIVEERGCVRMMGQICSSRDEDNNICGHHEKQWEQQMGLTQDKARNSMNSDFEGENKGWGKFGWLNI